MNDTSEQAFNMPQPLMYKGIEACYVNRANVFGEFLFI